MVVLEFDPTSKRVVITDPSDASIAIANVDDREHIEILGRHDAEVTFADWSSDGLHIATTSQDHTVRIWNVEDRTSTTIFRDPGPMSHVRWAPEGHRVGMLGDDRALGVQPIDPVHQRVAISTPGFLVRRFAWHPDGTRIFSDSGNPLAHVWNADGTGFPFVLTHPRMNVAQVSATPDGKHIVVRPDDDVIFIWPDVKPFLGPDDPRLWTATTFCIPVAVRTDLLGVDKSQAQRDEEACQRRVKLPNATKPP